MKIDKVLAHAGFMPIPSTDSRFVARDRLFFLKNGSRVDLKKSFRERYLNVAEGPMSSVILHYSRVIRPSVYDPVVSEIGRNVIATTLAILCFLLEHQRVDSGGPLLTSGFSNVLFIPDEKKVVRAVHVLAYKQCWEVSVNNISSDVELRAGRLVFHF